MRRWNWLCGGMSVRGFVVFEGEEGILLSGGLYVRETHENCH